jgi:hypothetical protein
MPKYVIEREIPGVGNLNVKNCTPSHRNLAAY